MIKKNKRKQTIKRTEFSKKMLQLDYKITILILIVYLCFEIINAVYMSVMQARMLNTGMIMSITYPFDMGAFTTILSVWVAQLGISSTAYYIMCKSDHKIQLPAKLINTLPEDIKKNVDMTTVITTVLGSTDN